MTRDEAIKAFNGISEPASNVWIDRFVALGILKLEEPKTPHQKLKEILSEQGWLASNVDEFRDALDRAGLMVVEK